MREAKRERRRERLKSSLIRVQNCTSQLCVPNSAAGRVNKMYDEWHSAEDGAHHDVD